MAIFTRFGTEVEIVGAADDFEQSGIVEVANQGRFRRPFHVSDLKADGGIAEIVAAARQAPLATTITRGRDK